MANIGGNHPVLGWGRSGEIGEHGTTMAVSKQAADQPRRVSSGA